jgi:hypothetical protein
MSCRLSRRSDSLRLLVLATREACGGQRPGYGAVGSASALGAEGRLFEPGYPDGSERTGVPEGL